MSARDGLRGRLVLMGLSAQAADRAIDAYAHELAEAQRAHADALEEMDSLDEENRNAIRYDVELQANAVRRAAGLIDPEVLP